LNVAHDLPGSGLDERLVLAARTVGWERLTPVQAAALPVLRRGGNLVLHASSGAGVTGAWALPLLDRLAAGAGADATGDDVEAGAEAAAGMEETLGDSGGGADEAATGAQGLRALVVAPTAERARAVAEALGALTGETGLAVRVTAPGWRTSGADVLVTTAERAMREVRDSTLKLESVQALVLLELAEQFEMKLEDALGTVVSLVPRDAQRVVTSARLEGEVERFIETHVRRPLTVPARPADPGKPVKQESAGQLGYLVLAEDEKAELLARLLDGVEGDVMVYARTAERAGRVHAELSLRGIVPAANARIHVVGFETEDGGAERVVSYDVPFAVEDLLRFHQKGGTVFVTPAELPHFLRIATEAAFTLKQRRARTFEATALDAFRGTVRSAIETEDLTAQLLVLDPLFDEYSHAEVAAALSALLRSRAPRRAAAGVEAGAAAPAGADSAAGPPPKEASTGAFTRLFISVGSKDNIRPGDLVGAITGEAGIKGEQVGRVDIRETFSVVEIAAPVADKVIRALNGTTMRGRSLRVDYDRKGSGGGEGGTRSGPRGSGGPPRGAGGPRSTGAPPRRRPPPSR
jgi:ATP-dependent RNA helicase DeaD